MNRTLLAILAALLAESISLVAESPATAISPREIPVEAFISPDDIGLCQLSPDGKHLAFATRLATGRIGVALMDLRTGALEPLFAAEDNDVNLLFWKGSDRIVFGTHAPDDWDALRSISLTSRKVVALSESDPITEWPTKHKIYVRVMDRLPTLPGKILVDGFVSKHSAVRKYQLMDVEDGSLHALEGENEPVDVTQVVASTGGQVMALVRSVDGKDVLQGWSNPALNFKNLAESQWGSPSWRLLGISGDNRTAYVVAETETGTNSLHTLNLETGEFGGPLLEVSDGAIKSLVQSRDHGKLLGVTIEGDKTRYHWFDPARARLQEQIDASLPGKWNEVIDASDDEALILIRSANDRDPGSYYILDDRAPRLMSIGKARSRIDPTLMCPMEPIHFKARDGLALQGYITRPRGHESSPAPLVVLPHPGPFEMRTSWGFDPTVQFLASRGYAVLQVNFRGSSGFGKAFEKAGWQQLGLKIQDDLADGVKWAIDNGIGDPGRVAIMGLSFGGYSAMMGLIRYPQVYRCAVNYWGQMDLTVDLWVTRVWSGHHRLEYFKTQFGENNDVLGSQSPIRLAEKINGPSLQIYLYPDFKPEFKPRYQMRDEIRLRMRERMQKAGKTFEEMVVIDEKLNEHWWTLQVDAHQRVERFLAKYLPAGN